MGSTAGGDGIRGSAAKGQVAYPAADIAGYGQPYMPAPRPAPGAGAGDTYASVAESGFRSAQQEPLSTVSMDVDTASYSSVRRFLQQG